MNKLITKIKKKFKTNIKIGQVTGGDIIALHGYKALYFAIPKVANSSMKAFCAELLKTEIDQIYYDPEWGPRPFRIPESRKLLKIKKILLKKNEVDVYSGYWRFALVRNPLDRLVSCYTQKIKDDRKAYSNKKPKFRNKLRELGFNSKMSFDDFAHLVCEIPDLYADSHFMSQYLHITDKNEKLIVDYVGHFENINSEFQKICEKIGIEDIELPHLLKSKRNHYKEYYTNNLRKKVEKRYEQDIRMFKY